MDNIVALPKRGHEGDLDTLGQLAAFAVMASELAYIAGRMAVDGQRDITLNGERLRLTSDGMLAIAQDMLEQRQEILDAMGQRIGAEVAERVARRVAVVQEADDMLAAQLEARHIAPA
jgi:hypothetical protein